MVETPHELYSLEPYDEMFLADGEMMRGLNQLAQMLNDLADAKPLIDAAAERYYAHRQATRSEIGKAIQEAEAAGTPISEAGLEKMWNLTHAVYLNELADTVKHAFAPAHLGDEEMRAMVQTIGQLASMTPELVSNVERISAKAQTATPDYLRQILEGTAGKKGHER